MRGDARFFTGKESELKSIGISAERAENPATRKPAWWVPQDACDRAIKAGLKLWQVIEYPLRHLEEVLSDAVSNAP
jgi:hypothetical protein